MQSAADRPCLYFQGLGDLIVIEAVDTTEQQNLPMVFTQRVQRLANLLSLFPTLQSIDRCPVGIGPVVVVDGPCLGCLVPAHA